MPLTYDPVKGAPEVDLRQVQESAGELASGLRVFTTAPGTTAKLRGKLPSGLRVFSTAPGTT